MRRTLLLLALLTSCRDGPVLPEPKSDKNFDDPDEPAGGGLGDPPVLPREAGTDAGRFFSYPLPDLGNVTGMAMDATSRRLSLGAPPDSVVWFDLETRAFSRERIFAEAGQVWVAPAPGGAVAAHELEPRALRLGSTRAEVALPEGALGLFRWEAEKSVWVMGETKVHVLGTEPDLRWMRSEPIPQSPAVAAFDEGRAVVVTANGMGVDLTPGRKSAELWSSGCAPPIFAALRKSNVVVVCRGGTLEIRASSGERISALELGTIGIPTFDAGLEMLLVPAGSEILRVRLDPSPSVLPERIVLGPVSRVLAFEGVLYGWDPAGHTLRVTSLQ